MRLLKLRQERFCRYFVEYACSATAARAAGYAPGSSRNAGYRLLRQPRIARRIAEIEAETAERHNRHREVLLGKLENIYRRANANHQFHAAARAIDLQAKLRGFAVPAARADGEGEVVDAVVDAHGSRPDDIRIAERLI